MQAIEGAIFSVIFVLGIVLVSIVDWLLASALNYYNV
ncbi:MAG: hypothetical protein ACI9J2_000531 [Saprospiraceae bacterium]|jgi:hypothetical protein